MLKISHLFWILIVHSCDESTIFADTTSPVQTFVGWNASFNIQLDPYPTNDSIIQIVKNGTLLMRVKGTFGQGVAERFEFTGNTFENRISFILRNIKIGDAGTYTATEVGFPPGREQKLIVKVAPSKPQIVAITGSAVLGSDYRLNCSSVSNSAPPDHGLTMMSEWKVNDQLITAGGRYKVQGTELTIGNLTRQDNNIKLTCVVYEDSLMKSVPSSEHVIDVMYGPGNSVNLGSNNSTLIVDLHQRSPDITCSATCNPPCDYRWYHNRSLYSNGTTLSLGVVANKTSGGNYTCEAFNRLLGSEVSSSTSVSIHVYYGAEIVSLSIQDNNTVDENSSAIFQCQVDSNPLPTVIWKKEGINTVLKTESGVVQSQFRIESAQCQDTDNYTCSAYNGIWTQANRTLQIFVKCHPRTDSEVPPETKVYNKRYGDAFLRYTVISYPLPKFTWMFLGNGSESKDLPSSAKPYVNGRQSELRFTSLNVDDFGYYSVIADNSLPPSAREVFEIISADVPEVPSNITITDVTENSITVHWVAGYNGGPKQTFYVFASTSDFTRNFTASDPGYGNIGTVVIKGLAARTKYSIYMSASNSIGSSSVTEAIFVFTLEAVGRELEVKGGANVAAIAGGICAAVVVVVILVVLFFIWRKKTSMLKNSSDKGFSNSVQGRSNQTGNLYANTSYSGDVINTGYESLQACKTEASPYQTLSSGDTETSDQNKDCSESMTIGSAGAGKIYMNIAITCPLSDKEYESLQSNQIETNQYQVLNDCSQPNNIRLSAGDNQLNPYYNVRQAAL